MDDACSSATFHRLLSETHTTYSDIQESDISPRCSADNAEMENFTTYRDWDQNIALKSIPISMQDKRDVRNFHHQQRRTITGWESWKHSQSILRRRLLDQICLTLSALQPWRLTLRNIEGRYGVGVKAYFVFLRSLLYLNLCLSLLTGGLVQLPSLLFSKTQKKNSQGYDVQDFFLGTGILDRSPVFYGFYERGSLDWVCLNTSLLYLLGVSSVLILSMVVVVCRTTTQYKHKWMLGDWYSMSISHKLFCGWDFCIQDPKAAVFKHIFIRNDIKLDLEEKQFQIRKSQRTTREKIFIYFVRFILNFVVIILLGSAFCFIYYSTEFSKRDLLKEGSKMHWLISFFVKYLPPITITIVNFLLPQFFRIISRFEGCSISMQVNITLIRSIFLKLSSLGIFLFFLYRNHSKNKEKDSKDCWENHFGQEMYKLQVFDFLACFGVTFLVLYPRKLLTEKYPESYLVKLIGRKEFIISLIVLDLVYTQTVTWVGVFYCPLMPQICVLKLFAVFYLQKFMLHSCCEPSHRMFRASSPSVLFHFVLLLGLLMAVMVLGITINTFPPSPTHGPFSNSSTVFNVTTVCVDSWPSLPRNILRYLMSEAFALPLILTEIIILTSSVSQKRANQKYIDRLKNILVMCGSDKRLLVRQHATLLRTQGKTLQSSVSYTSGVQATSDVGGGQLNPMGFQSLLVRSISEP